MTPNRADFVLLGLLTVFGCGSKAEPGSSSAGTETSTAESDETSQLSNGDSTESGDGTETNATGDGDVGESGDEATTSDDEATTSGDEATTSGDEATTSNDEATTSGDGDGDECPDDGDEIWDPIPTITASRDDQGVCTFSQIGYECGQTSQYDSTCGGEGGDVDCGDVLAYGYFRVNADDSVSIAYDNTCRGFAGFEPCSGDIDDPTPIQGIPLECLCLCDDGNPLMP